MAMSSEEFQSVVNANLARTSEGTPRATASAASPFAGRTNSFQTQDNPGFFQALWEETKKPVVGLVQDVGYGLSSFSPEVQKERAREDEAVAKLRDAGRNEEADLLFKSYNRPTFKKVVGDVAGTALTAAMFIPGADVIAVLGKVGLAGKTLQTVTAVERAAAAVRIAKRLGDAEKVVEATQALKAVQAASKAGKYAGAIRASVEGFGFGAVQGAASAASDNKDAEDILKNTGYGALGGLAVGAGGAGTFALSRAGLTKLASIPFVNDAVNSEVSIAVKDFFTSTGKLLEQRYGETGKKIKDLIDISGYHEEQGVARYLGILNYSWGNFKKKYGDILKTDQSYKVFETEGIKFNKKSAEKLNRYLYLSGKILPDEQLANVSTEAGFVTGRLNGSIETGNANAVADSIRVSDSQPTVGYGAREGIVTKSDIPEPIQQSLPRNVLRIAKGDVSKEVIVRGHRVQVTDPETGDISWKPFNEVVKNIENYKPHVTIGGRSEDFSRFGRKTLIDGTVNPDWFLTVQQSVDQGYFKDFKEASEAFDAWIDFAKKKGVGMKKDNAMIKYVMRRNGVDEAKARSLLMRERDSIQTAKLGNFIERERYVDHPFFNPYEDESMLTYVADSVRRLEQGAQLGFDPANPTAFTEIDKAEAAIRERLGSDTIAADEAAKDFRKLVDMSLRRVNASSKSDAVSLFLRRISVPKLAFAQIINLGQGFLNSAAATDLPTAFRGIARAMTKVGSEKAQSSGATLNSIIHEAISPSLSSADFSDAFLRATGFVWTEQFNRTVGSNTFEIWAQKNFDALLKHGMNGDVFSMEKVLRLKELGIDAEKAIARGSLTKNELLTAMQIGTGRTQFLSRPTDLPYWASSPAGKVFFQFKNFSYQQTKFLKDELSYEMASGNYKRAARTILTLATIFPMTGEALQDIRSLVTQKRRPTKALDRYMDDISSAGSFAILGDFIQSSQYGGVEFTAPVVSMAQDILTPVTGIARETITGGEPSKEVKNLVNAGLRQLGVTQPILNMMAEKKKGKESSIESIHRLFFE